jgi:UDP-N-acetyl-D-mannosaminuronic acid dehydrogenase
MHLPGAGVGGHCLPKDTWLLLYGLKMYGSRAIETHFVELARDINEKMPYHLVDLATDCFTDAGLEYPNVKVVVLGAAYLENSDDTRNTPTSSVVARLSAYGAEVIVHDPYVREFPETELTRDLAKAVKDADALLLVTKHREYLSMDLKKVGKSMRHRIIIDGRGAIEPASARDAGFVYRGIGKGNAGAD